ncbi:MAG: universal stress protein [Candidatus Syntrophonatronum acetioxidans]|uniref:Universal stress protein n=1 Tax=Candidatus Syntrophonatronum acetioxidans TaxID=1795816 RepID=A0A424YGH9_9FIRM|nr:MAG: universal stress protein [Candidatus Syntrophonatronum acetioxidans]
MNFFEEVFKLNKILAPTDGSLESIKAVKKAAEIAESFSAELVVVNAQDIHVESVSTDIKERRRKAEKVFALVKEELRGIEPKTSYKMLEGNPADEICKFAEKDNFDLIVMGARGLSGIKKFLLGSVADKVVHHAKVPVMINR